MPAAPDLLSLIAEIERLWAAPPESPTAADLDVVARLLAALDRGEARAAEPDPEPPLGWRTNPWVKRGILLGFRMGRVVDMSAAGFPFFDKSTFPLRSLTGASGVRVVPGGSAIRAGVYLGQGVICMPPMYINAGAYVDDGTLVDSHALVGSCAQVGKRVHLSAAAQLGGVIEPVGALPVIVEDEVLIGGNCGVYEGTVVKRRAVLAAGTILTRSTPVYDLVKETIHRASGDEPLVIPEGAVVVPGSRAVTKGAGRDWGISLATPVIVKYRDEGTDSRVQLEDWVR
ncbi:MAG: 2,3,4,5-tetrahydropyridine-2,6-dicarboxylate N-succinyltransferase [Acidobacteriota bacterium]|jgi:2,3,4,5-tetrahydropyridine-2-carboxylate N-succinyltransferase|nr:2,3,4,5-tetrahydropyridine-2,6-dicarboxylate N-succinyltransferase [Acidobacteriota bacterium]